MKLKEENKPIIKNVSIPISIIKTFMANKFISEKVTQTFPKLLKNKQLTDIEISSNYQIK